MPALLIAAGVVAYLVLAPMALTVYASVRTVPGHLPLEPAAFTAQNYARVFLDPSTYQLILNSLVFAAGSLLLGFVLAFTFAWLVERTALPGRTLIFALILVPLAIPGLLSAIGWILLLGPGAGIINVALRAIAGAPAGTQGPINIFSLAGMIFVDGIRVVPPMFLFIAPALSLMDPSLEEQSRVSGRSWAGTLRRITAPVVAPALAAALIFFAIGSLEAFDVPGVLGLTAGVRVFSTRIYNAAQPTGGGIPDYGQASTLGILIAIICLALLFGHQRLTRHAERFATITGRGYRPKPIDLRGWRYPALGLVVLYLIVSVALPFLVLLWGSLIPFFQPPSSDAFQQVSLKAYQDFRNYPGVAQATLNTLVVGLIAATATVALVTVTGWIVRRTRIPGRKLLDLLVFLPIAIPGIVVGLALVLVYISFPNPIYGTIWIIILGLMTKGLAVSSRLVDSGYLQVHRELEEASRVAGAPWSMTILRVLVPLLTPALINTWILLFLFGVRELSLPLIVGTPDSQVIATLIWSLWNSGRTAEVSAMAVLLILVLAIATVGARLASQRMSRTRLAAY
ncbi:MAG: iron ABC transporter permease [Chloroflexi bacterium]|nr:iron ABC transporter permease [Chloroflexota bacterium]